MRFRFYTADVFTDRAFSGNPLAVVPDAWNLDGARMQLLTREFNLSETVFVLPPRNPAHTARLRIFTPLRELPFAGHPTVGAAHVLAAIGNVAIEARFTRVIFEEGVGPVPVTIVSKDGRPVTCQLTAAKLPEIGPPPPSSGDLAEMLSLDEGDIASGIDHPEGVSAGLPVLFVPLRGLDAVRRARLRPDKWESLLAGYWSQEVYVFTHECVGEEAQIHARLFAPGVGVEEDPATGSAAAALAGYLGHRDEQSDGTLRWIVEQGIEMGRPSRLEVEADKKGGEITAVRVGGSSVLMMEGTIEIP